MVEKWFQTVISASENQYLVKIEAFRSENARKIARIIIADILDVHEALLEATTAEETTNDTNGFHLIGNIYIKQLA